MAETNSVKSVRVRSFFGHYLPTFGLNTERYRVSLRIQSECGKIRTRKTPNTDTFYAVIVKVKLLGTSYIIVYVITVMSSSFVYVLS